MSINIWKGEYWAESYGVFKRDLSTIVLDKTNRKDLIGHIDSFINEKEWYIKNGIPYRTGILLKGPPGTGKTSLLKGLCTHYKKDLYLLQLAGMTDKSFLDALTRVPAGSIIAIEDIDTCSITTSRDIKKEKEQGTSLSDFSTLSLSGLLNGIDGVASGDNRILIATTNHPEKLDNALIREGRFDLKLEIGYVSNEMLREFFKKFYPKHKIPKDYAIKENTAPCEVQTLIFSNRNNPDEVLNKLKLVSKLEMIN